MPLLELEPKPELPADGPVPEAPEPVAEPVVLPVVPPVMVPELEALFS